MTSQSMYYAEMSRRQARYTQPKKDPPFWHWFALGIFFLLFLAYCLNYLNTNEIKLKYKDKTESVKIENLKDK